MAFRREVLEAINGFDPQFRKAGDDVDICWRLQHEGLLITFAPGAFVWHHRRQNPRSYLRQQAGYGEAEALLHSKHPDKFNGRGDGKWGGVMYGGSLAGPPARRADHLSRDVRDRDVPVPLSAGRRPLGDVAQYARMAGGRPAARPGGGARPVPGGGSSGRACWACRCWSPPCRPLRPASSRPTGAGAPGSSSPALCYAQPLVRSWTRYRTRLSSQRAPGLRSVAIGGPRAAIAIDGPSVGGLLVGGGS